MKIKKTIKYILLAVFLIYLGYFSMIFFSSRSVQKEMVIISNENTSGKVLGEEGSVSQMFSSENFHAPQISFGGEAITFPSGQQALAPEILNLRSELFTTKSDQQAKFLLSWKTSKPCLSSIVFKKEGASDSKIVSEEGYGFIHSAALSPLNFSTTYSYAVTAKDKWGNETQSDKLAFYTGAPNVSIFDLLGGAFKDMFGWAGR
ncbi:MAG: hypothetical protein V1814_02095 [Candidatus Moraniibacteriota bacterium]